VTTYGPKEERGAVDNATRRSTPGADTRPLRASGRDATSAAEKGIAEQRDGALRPRRCQYGRAPESL